MLMEEISWHDEKIGTICPQLGLCLAPLPWYGNQFTHRCHYAIQ
jgi:hypothetical protein